MNMWQVHPGIFGVVLSFNPLGIDLHIKPISLNFVRAETNSNWESPHTLHQLLGCPSVVNMGVNLQGVHHKRWHMLMVLVGDGG